MVARAKKQVERKEKQELQKTLLKKFEQQLMGAPGADEGNSNSNCKKDEEAFVRELAAPLSFKAILQVLAVLAVQVIERSRWRLTIHTP